MTGPHGRGRPWAIFLALLGAALAAVLRNEPSTYIADFRLELYWSPGPALARMPFLWDAVRDLGRAGGEFHPLPTLVIAAFRSLGASPAVALHLWHATLFFTAGAGAVLLLRQFRPRWGAEHLFVGLLYMFSPYSVVFIVPSTLYLGYALAPWLMWSLVAGCRGDRPWRHAAVFALAAWVVFTSHQPSFAYDIILLLPVMLYLVLVERSARWRDLLGWLARVGVLFVPMVVPVLVRSLYSSSALLARLSATESPDVVNSSSSWSESWRGLGFWLSYFRYGGELGRPHQAGFFEQPALILAGFVLPVAALVVLARSSWRPRLLFGGLAFLSVLLMVGSFPANNPSLYGRLLLEGYDSVPLLSTLRNSYKAGAGVSLAMACLVAVGAAELIAWARRRSWVPAGSRRPVVAVGLALVALVFVASFPAWTGNLYSSRARIDDIPQYWLEAANWLNDQPGDSRAIIVPGTQSTTYRWGMPGDDIADALIQRPHVRYSPFPRSTPAAADVIRALDWSITRDADSAQAFVDVAARLGIEYVVARNDLQWTDVNRPRPADLDGLREAAGLELVATFGEPGEQTTGGEDRSDAGEREASLPPIEVYRIATSDDQVRWLEDQPPLLVSGDGTSWFSVADAGLLGEAPPIAFTAQLAPEELLADLEAGSSLVVTDTNPRVQRLSSATEEKQSWVLSADEDLGRRSADLFRAPGSQTVLTTGVAERVTATSTAGTTAQFQPSHALDGDPWTWWMADAVAPDGAARWTVQFAEPVILDGLWLLPAAATTTDRRISKMAIEADGQVIATLRPEALGSTVPFAARPISELSIRILETEGAETGRVGLSEVKVGDLDLTPALAVPDDVTSAAAELPALDPALAEAPTAWLFARQLGPYGDRQEAWLRRRFDVVGERTAVLEGEIQLDASTPGWATEALAGATRGVQASSVAENVVGGASIRAVDGDSSAGWLAPPVTGQELRIDTGGADLGTLSIVLADAASRSTADDLTITYGGETRTAVPVSGDCKANTGMCTTSATVDLAGLSGSTIVVTLGEVTEVRNDGVPAPVEILEVESSEASLARNLGEELDDACRTDLLVLDGVGVPTRATGTVADLLAGEVLPFVGCEPITLADGSHLIGPTIGPVVTRMSLRTEGFTTGTAPTNRPVTVVSRTPTDVTISVDAGAGGTLVSGMSAAKGWKAWADGEPLGGGRSLDGQAAWEVPPGTSEIVLRYGPQQIFALAMVGLVLALGVCLVLVSGLVRRVRPVDVGSRTEGAAPTSSP